MKIRRNIYLALGLFCIFVNLFFSILFFGEISTILLSKKVHVGNKLSYLATTQWLMVAGLLFLFGYYRVQKKITRKNRQALENAFAD